MRIRLFIHVTIISICIACNSKSIEIVRPELLCVKWNPSGFSGNDLPNLVAFVIVPNERPNRNSNIEISYKNDTLYFPMNIPIDYSGKYWIQEVQILPIDFPETIQGNSTLLKEDLKYIPNLRIRDELKFSREFKIFNVADGHASPEVELLFKYRNFAMDD